jgi:hypothetical protein
MPENSTAATTTEYQIERTRNRFEGIDASPIAGPGPQNASLVRLYAPIEFESVFFSASRVGAPPLVPSPDCFNTNNNRVFLGGQQSALVGVPTLDGGHTYCMAGCYYFAIVGPEGLGSNFRLGKMPWEDTTALGNFVPSTNFLALGILDPTMNSTFGLAPDPYVPLLQMAN